MSTPGPVTDLHPSYSADDAQPTEWAQASEALANAELSWITTVRPDGRPHVTPLLTVWVDSALHFCTGPEERKCKNVMDNPNVVLTTGANTRREGLDLVVEGVARRVTDEPSLRRLAQAWVDKYGDEWRFDVVNGAFRHAAGHGEAWVFAVKPSTAFGFGKAPYSQTRWRFGQD